MKLLAAFGVLWLVTVGVVVVGGGLAWDQSWAEERHTPGGSDG